MKLIINSIFLASYMLIPFAHAIDTQEVKRFCKRTNNYRKCIKEFNISDDRVKKRVNNNAIEIEVIPYKD